MQSTRTRHNEAERSGEKQITELAQPWTYVRGKKCVGLRFDSPSYYFNFLQVTAFEILHGIRLCRASRVNTRVNYLPEVREIS